MPLIREAIANGELFRAHAFEHACAVNDIEHRHDQGQASVDQRSGRTDEPDHQGSHRQALPLRRATTNSAGISPTSSPPTTSAAGSRPSRASPPTSSSAEPGQPSPTLHIKSAPSNAGTKHLGRSGDRQIGVQAVDDLALRRVASRTRSLLAFSLDRRPSISPCNASRVRSLPGILLLMGAPPCFDRHPPAEVETRHLKGCTSSQFPSNLRTSPVNSADDLRLSGLIGRVQQHGVCYTAII